MTEPKPSPPPKFLDAFYLTNRFLVLAVTNTIRLLVGVVLFIVRALERNRQR